MNCDFNYKELTFIRNSINVSLNNIKFGFGFHEKLIGEENLKSIVLEFLSLRDKIELLIDACDEKIPPI